MATLENLTVEFELQVKNIQKQINDVRKQIEQSQIELPLKFNVKTIKDLNNIKLSPQVNFKPLHDLNKLLDIKLKHYKQVQSYFKNNPLVDASKGLLKIQQGKIEIVASSDLEKIISNAVKIGSTQANQKGLLSRIFAFPIDLISTTFKGLLFGVGAKLGNDIISTLSEKIVSFNKETKAKLEELINLSNKDNPKKTNKESQVKDVESFLNAVKSLKQNIKTDKQQTSGKTQIPSLEAFNLELLQTEILNNIKAVQSNITKNLRKSISTSKNKKKVVVDVNNLINTINNINKEIDNATRLIKSTELKGKESGKIRQRLGGFKGTLTRQKNIYQSLLEQIKIEFPEQIANKQEKIAIPIEKLSNDIKAGLKIAFETAGESAGSDLGKGIIKGTEDELGIASPSKEAIRIGEQFNEGIIIGLLNSQNKLEIETKKNANNLIQITEETAKFTIENTITLIRKTLSQIELTQKQLTEKYGQIVAETLQISQPLVQKQAIKTKQIQSTGKELFAVKALRQEVLKGDTDQAFATIEKLTQNQNANIQNVAKRLSTSLKGKKSITDIIQAIELLEKEKQKALITYQKELSLIKQEQVKATQPQTTQIKLLTEQIDLIKTVKSEINDELNKEIQSLKELKPAEAGQLDSEIIKNTKKELDIAFANVLNLYQEKVKEIQKSSENTLNNLTPQVVTFGEENAKIIDEFKKQFNKDYNSISQSFAKQIEIVKQLLAQAPLSIEEYTAQLEKIEQESATIKERFAKTLEKTKAQTTQSELKSLLIEQGTGTISQAVTQSIQVAEKANLEDSFINFLKKIESASSQAQVQIIKEFVAPSLEKDKKALENLKIEKEQLLEREKINEQEKKLAQVAIERRKLAQELAPTLISPKSPFVKLINQLEKVTLAGFKATEISKVPLINDKLITSLEKEFANLTRVLKAENIDVTDIQKNSKNIAVAFSSALQKAETLLSPKQLQAINIQQLQTISQQGLSTLGTNVVVDENRKNLQKEEKELIKLLNQFQLPVNDIIVNSNTLSERIDLMGKRLMSFATQELNVLTEDIQKRQQEKGKFRRPVGIVETTAQIQEIQTLAKNLETTKAPELYTKAKSVLSAFNIEIKDVVKGATTENEVIQKIVTELFSLTTQLTQDNRESLLTFSSVSQNTKQELDELIKSVQTAEQKQKKIPESSIQSINRLTKKRAVLVGQQLSVVTQDIFKTFQTQINTNLKNKKFLESLTPSKLDKLSNKELLNIAKQLKIETKGLKSAKDVIPLIEVTKSGLIQQYDDNIAKIQESLKEFESLKKLSQDLIAKGTIPSELSPEARKQLELGIIAARQTLEKAGITPVDLSLSPKEKTVSIPGIESIKTIPEQLKGVFPSLEKSALFQIFDDSLTALPDQLYQGIRTQLRQIEDKKLRAELQSVLDLAFSGIDFETSIPNFESDAITLRLNQLKQGIVTGLKETTLFAPLKQVANNVGKSLNPAFNALLKNEKQLKQFVIQLSKLKIQSESVNIIEDYKNKIKELESILKQIEIGNITDINTDQVINQINTFKGAIAQLQNEVQQVKLDDTSFQNVTDTIRANLTTELTKLNELLTTTKQKFDQVSDIEKQNKLIQRYKELQLAISRVNTYINEVQKSSKKEIQIRTNLFKQELKQLETQAIQVNKNIEELQKSGKSRKEIKARTRRFQQELLQIQSAIALVNKNIDDIQKTALSPDEIKAKTALFKEELLRLSKDSIFVKQQIESNVSIAESLQVEKTKIEQEIAKINNVLSHDLIPVEIIDEQLISVTKDILEKKKEISQFNVIGDKEQLKQSGTVLINNVKDIFGKLKTQIKDTADNLVKQYPILEDFANNIKKQGLPATLGLVAGFNLLQLGIFGLGNALQFLGNFFQQVFSSAITATVELEKFNAMLGLTTGNSQLASQSLQRISKDAQDLGLSIASVQEQFAKFASATVGTALEKDVERIFKGFATASSALSLSESDIQGVFTALTQIVAKGKVTSEEFRQQLSERLPIASQVAAEALGVTQAQFTKLLDTGRLKLTDLVLIADKLSEKFGEVKNINTAAKAIERLKNEIYLSSLALGQSLLPVVKILIDSLTNGIKFIRNALQVSLIPLLLGTASIFRTQILQVIRVAGVVIVDLFKTIGTFLLKNIASMGIFALKFVLLSTILDGIGQAIRSIGVSWGVWESRIQSVVKATEASFSTASKQANKFRDVLLNIQKARNINLNLTVNNKAFDQGIQEAQKTLEELTPNEKILGFLPSARDIVNFFGAGKASARFETATEFLTLASDNLTRYRNEITATELAVIRLSKITPIADTLENQSVVDALDQQIASKQGEIALLEEKQKGQNMAAIALRMEEKEAEARAFEEAAKDTESEINAVKRKIIEIINERSVRELAIRTLAEQNQETERRIQLLDAEKQASETEIDKDVLKGLKTEAQANVDKLKLTSARLKEELALEQANMAKVIKTRQEAYQVVSELTKIPIDQLTDRDILEFLPTREDIAQETRDLYTTAITQFTTGNSKLKQLRLEAEKADLEIIKGGIDEKLDQLNRETELKINTLENSFERNKYLIETQAKEEKKLESIKNIELLAEEIDHNNKLIKIKTNRLRRIKLLLKDETKLTKDQYKELLNEALSLETEINNLQLQSLNNQKDMVGTRISQIDEEISAATEAQSVHTLKVQSIIAKKLAEGAIFQKEASLMSMQYKEIETKALISFDEYRIKELERLQKTIGLTADQEKELVKARNQLATSKFEAPKKLYDEFIQSAQDGIDLLEFSAKQRESSIQQLVNSGVISRKEADRQLAESNRQLNRDRYDNDYDYFLRLQEFNKENPTIEGYKEIEQRAKALNDLQNQLLQDEYQKQQELIDLANDKLNQQAKYLDLRNQELDLQLKLLDIQTKALDSQQRLFEAQNRLNTALANLETGRNQLIIDELNHQLEINSNEKEQLRLKKEIYALEKKATRDKVKALIAEQKQQLISLDIEENRMKIEARRTAITNQQALNQAQNQILQQQIALNDAKRSGDKVEIELATQSLDLAYQQLGLTQQEIAENNKLLALDLESAKLNRQTTETEQRLAREQLAQEESFRLNSIRRETEGLENKLKNVKTQTDQQLKEKTAADREIIVDESTYLSKVISDTGKQPETATEDTAQEQLMTLEEIKRDNRLRAELEGNLFDLLQRGVMGNQGQIIGNPENNQKIKDTFENVTLKTLNLPQMVTPTITIDTPKQLQFQNTLLDGLNKIYQQLINIGGQKPVINQTNEFVNQFASNNEKELLRQARNQTLTDLNNLFAQMA
jgi:tape measure domain-containing protein